MIVNINTQNGMKLSLRVFFFFVSVQIHLKFPYYSLNRNATGLTVWYSLFFSEIMANAPPPNSAPTPPSNTTTTTTIRPPVNTTTTVRTVPTTTNAPPSGNDSPLGIGTGFGILAVLLLVAIIYACFLYRRLMRTAQINRRASSIFSKLSRKKVISTNQAAADSPDAPGLAGGPRQESSSDARRGSGADSQAKKPPSAAIKSDDKIYLDMNSSGTKGAGRTQKFGYVNQNGPVETPPIYDTVNEVSFASDPPTYENFDEGRDNPIYENLEKDTDPLYINITPTATPTPSPSHSPRGHKNLQAMKSSEYVLMSNSGPNTSL